MNTYKRSLFLYVLNDFLFITNGPSTKIYTNFVLSLAITYRVIS